MIRARRVLDICVEILKVVVIAAAAAIAVERLLLREPEDDPHAALRKIGIEELFAARQDAGPEFLRSVQDKNVRRITISGISLRDFLPAGGTLYAIWQEIRERLKREEISGRQSDERLHVQLLLIMPNSHEGYFRHAVEGEVKRIRVEYLLTYHERWAAYGVYRRKSSEPRDAIFTSAPLWSIARSHSYLLQRAKFSLSSMIIVIRGKNRLYPLSYIKVVLLSIKSKCFR